MQNRYIYLTVLHLNNMYYDIPHMKICSDYTILLLQSKVFHGQWPPSGEYTITVCVVTYQILATAMEVDNLAFTCCGQPQALRTMASE